MEEGGLGIVGGGKEESVEDIGDYWSYLILDAKAAAVDSTAKFIHEAATNAQVLAVTTFCNVTRSCPLFHTF